MGGMNRGNEGFQLLTVLIQLLFILTGLVEIHTEEVCKGSSLQEELLVRANGRDAAIIQNND